jgi:hypothetical protein
MRAIAGRHLDAGCHADVEARLVVDKNDVRRWRGGPAHIREGRQAVGSDGVGLHQPMRHQFGNGVDAGAGEGGYEIATVKGFERLQRKMRFQRDKAADAAQRQKCGNASAHAQRIEAPSAYYERYERQETQRHDRLQRREDREQETDGVGIDDHQIDEVRRHHQDIVFKLRQQHDERHQHERDETGEQRPPRQCDRHEIEDSPSQQECRHRGNAGFGCDHDRQCEDVRSGDCRQPARSVPDRQSRNVVTQAQNVGTQIARPCPEMSDPSDNSPSARCAVMKL